MTLHAVWLFSAVALLGADAADPGLRQELLAMEAADQAPFRKTAVIALSPSDWHEIAGMRKRHAARLEEIVARHGWPGRTLAGRDGANAAFLIVQHADHDVAFQRRCLGLMEPLLAKGEVSKIDFAYLTDRVRVNQGRLQLYGTQTKRGPDGRLRPLPVEDPKNLDRRRNAVGLPGERKYLKQVERMEGRPLR